MTLTTCISWSLLLLCTTSTLTSAGEARTQLWTLSVSSRDATVYEWGCCNLRAKNTPWPLCGAVEVALPLCYNCDKVFRVSTGRCPPHPLCFIGRPQTWIQKWHLEPNLLKLLVLGHCFPRKLKNIFRKLEFGLVTWWRRRLWPGVK